jgi:DNA replication and repair protein RecF
MYPPLQVDETLAANGPTATDHRNRGPLPAVSRPELAESLDRRRRVRKLDGPGVIAPTADAAGIGKSARVSIGTLKLAQFRNYQALDLTIDQRPVVLTGPNGAGKTNLLEAISFLSPGRGLRRARLTEVARHAGDGSWAVSATITGPQGEAEIGTGITIGAEGPEPRRSVRVNRAPAPNTEALLEHVRVVWLTPAMDGLFTGAASERRRFLDRLVLAIDGRHGARVNAYERAMRERNRLFEQGRSDARWYNAVEAQMAELGVAIAAARRECVGLLSAATAEVPADGPFPASGISLAGSVENMLDAAGATGAEDLFRQALRDGRSADRAAGRTLSGPHLTDLAVTHLPKAAGAAECSTGEQKALLIGIVLAHARLIAKINGETPIILLDEVAAHLDPSRREALFGILVHLGAQAWMTGTETASFAPFGALAHRFHVEDGAVKQDDPLPAA